VRACLCAVNTEQYSTCDNYYQTFIELLSINNFVIAESLLKYAYRDSQVPALFSANTSDGRGLFVDTMTSLGDELYVCPLRLSSGNTPLCEPNVIRIYDATSLAWKRDIAIPIPDHRAKIVRLQVNNVYHRHIERYHENSK